MTAPADLPFSPYTSGYRWALNQNLHAQHIVDLSDRPILRKKLGKMRREREKREKAQAQEEAKSRRIIGITEREKRERNRK